MTRTEGRLLNFNRKAKSLEKVRTPRAACDERAKEFSRNLPQTTRKDAANEPRGLGRLLTARSQLMNTTDDTLLRDYDNRR